MLLLCIGIDVSLTFVCHAPRLGCVLSLFDRHRARCFLDWPPASTLRILARLLRSTFASHNASPSSWRSSHSVFAPC